MRHPSEVTKSLQVVMVQVVVMAECFGKRFLSLDSEVRLHLHIFLLYLQLACGRFSG